MYPGCRNITNKVIHDTVDHLSNTEFYNTVACLEAYLRALGGYLGGYLNVYMEVCQVA